MSKRKYTHMQALLPEIKAMLEEGKSHKAIEDLLELNGDRPVHNLLKRERQREETLRTGIQIKPKGC